MTLWTIIPRDPLIFRDGKPFTAAPGARAKSLPFPFPSTIVGAVRTMAGTDPKTGKFDKSRIAELLKKHILGPVLVELEKGEIKDYLFPAPADALLLMANDEELARRQWVRPIKTPSEALTDLENLSLVGPKEIIKKKPHPKQPRFWRKGEYFKWLEKPTDHLVNLSKLGHNGPQTESRTHVSINPKTHTAAPGALFQTSGLEYSHTEKKDSEDDYIKLNEARTLAMVVETNADLRDSLGFLGGERRIVQWLAKKAQLPSCPDKVIQNIKEQGACRLILLTPAYFRQGYLPTWLQEEHSIEIVGAAVPRYNAVSGWDYKVGAPKPTRRLAPAGSVYFIKIEQNAEDFINSVWMKTVSDGAQNRLDGFGLAVLGIWDGTLKDMEVE